EVGEQTSLLQELKPQAFELQKPVLRVPRARPCFSETVLRERNLVAQRSDRATHPRVEVLVPECAELAARWHDDPPHPTAERISTLHRPGPDVPTHNSLLAC